MNPEPETMNPAPRNHKPLTRARPSTSPPYRREPLPFLCVHVPFSWSSRAHPQWHVQVPVPIEVVREVPVPVEKVVYKEVPVGVQMGQHMEIRQHE